MNARPRRRPLRLALTLLLLLCSLLPSGPAAEAAPAAPPPTCTNTPFWRCRYRLSGLAPTSVTSEGLSLFMMDPKAARILQLRFNDDGSLTQIDMPWLPLQPGVNAELGSIVLGPRAFYAIVTLPDASHSVESTVPYMFRADRIPTAMSGGWRLLRQTAGPADYLSSVAMNGTVWMLRSCDQQCLDARRKGSNAAFAVDWQPLATENSQVLQPPGPTIDLGDAVKARPAAGVTATQDAIYVFGGQGTPRSATRIPLKNGTPGRPIQMPDLPEDRVGATALVHATTVYLVGGNGATGPVVMRSKIEERADPRNGTLIGNVQTWESVPAPNMNGATVSTAVFARGQLWLIRSDGWIESMDVGATVPGQSRLSWAPVSVRINGGAPFTVVAPQPIKIHHGDKIDLTLDWDYSGAQTFQGVTVDVAGQPADPGKKKSPSFIATADGALRSQIDLALDPPASDGQPIALHAEIPTQITDPRISNPARAIKPDKRTEYNATVQVSAGGHAIGPVQRLRFVIDRPKVH